MTFPVISEIEEIQSAYVVMRKAGESHNIAEILAMRITPGLRGTERMFFEGHCNGNQFAMDSNAGKKFKRAAKRAGVDTTGAVYVGGLADYPGDPKAWVKDTSDIKRVLKERNWSARGAVNHKAHDEALTGFVPIADDIVDRETAKEIAIDPGKKAKIKQVREEVKDRLTPSWKKGG
jgi:hypothetical protein